MSIKRHRGNLIIIIFIMVIKGIRRRTYALLVIALIREASLVRNCQSASVLYRSVYSTFPSFRHLRWMTGSWSTQVMRVKYSGICHWMADFLQTCRSQIAWRTTSLPQQWTLTFWNRTSVAGQQMPFPRTKNGTPKVADGQGFQTASRWWAIGLKIMLQAYLGPLSSCLRRSFKRFISASLGLVPGAPYAGAPP